MKLIIKSIWGIIPVPVLITDWGMGYHVGGKANGPIAFIRPRYHESGDLGILNHELNHVKQFYIPFGISIIICGLAFGIFQEYQWWMSLILALGFSSHSLMYKFIPKYRLWSEVACYKIQAKYYADYAERIRLFSTYIVNYYNLKVSQLDVHRLLLK